MLAVADIIALLALGLTVLAVVLRGSDKTYERLFRLLRWIANRPEPPAPPGNAADSFKVNEYASLVDAGAASKDGVISEGLVNTRENDPTSGRKLI
jgi:hypothetical protein